AGEAGGLERADAAALELDRRDEVIVDRAAGHDRAHVGRHGDDLADEVAREVDHVRAEVAERAGPGLRGVEAPEAGIRVPAPRLEVTRAEVDDLAELAGVEELAREADGGDEAVVEAAQVADAGALGLLPQLVRLRRGEPERLLAEDVLAGAR